MKLIKQIILATALICVNFASYSADAGGTPLKGAFSWGADAGASIDMTGKDMSSVDFSASFGYKRGWLNFLGAGAGVEFPVSSSPRSYSFFASLATNFSNRPTPLFVCARVGVSVNYLPYNTNYTGVYATGGVGINLARSDKFTSYIIVGCTFRQRDVTVKESGEHYGNLHYASVKLGINF